MDKPRRQVAAGIIRNEFGQIYLTQRLEGQDFAQSLEFPGVTEWIGEPFGREGQEGFWLEQRDLDPALFPPANAKLIQRLLAES